MKTPIRFLKELLDEAEQFLDEQSQPELNAFAQWLLIRQQENARLETGRYRTETVEGDNLRFLVHLHRFAKGYTKRALEGSPLRTVEEFSVLIRLQAAGDCTKATLIREMILEFSAGAEIFKRMIRQGLISEQPNEADKRQKILSITEEGQTVVESVLGQVYQVAQVVNGTLSETEKSQLHFLLGKLHGFHWDVRYAQNHDSLNSIVEANGLNEKEAAPRRERPQH